MKPTAANQKYARRLVEEIRTKLAAGVFVMVEYFPELAANSVAGAGVQTVGDLLDLWVSTTVGSESTYAQHKSDANFWKGVTYRTDRPDLPLGLLPLNQLRASHIRIAIASRPDLAASTVRLRFLRLKRALRLAKDDGLLKELPTESITTPKVKKDPPDPFDAAERDTIIQAFHSQQPGHLANWVQFNMWAGLRVGEVFALRWDNVNLDERTVFVCERFIRKQRLPGTKTGYPRTVKLNSQAYAALLAQKTLTYGKEDGTVFPDYRSGLLITSTQQHHRVWGKMVRSLGIRYRSMYHMRHTYATTMLMANMTHSFCAKQLGHSVKEFQETYSKWIDGVADDFEMARLEERIIQSPTGQPQQPDCPKIAPNAQKRNSKRKVTP